MRRPVNLQSPTGPEHHGPAIVQIQSWIERHEERLTLQGEVIAEIRTAQKLHREDFQEALAEMREEMRHARRTAFGILVTLLSSAALTMLGFALSRLVK